MHFTRYFNQIVSCLLIKDVFARIFFFQRENIQVEVICVSDVGIQEKEIKQKMTVKLHEDSKKKVEGQYRLNVSNTIVPQVTSCEEISRNISFSVARP